jgi:2'-5' RNA ligase
MRAFFCIPLQAGPRGSIASAAERVRARSTMRASWVQPENYHLTVRFLGEIDPTFTAKLEGLAMGVAEDRQPFRLTLDRLGAFPNFDRARILWFGGDAVAAYVDLVRTLNERLRSAGFDPERKRPAAHVTIARIKGRPDAALERVIGELEPVAPQCVGVDRIVLMESRLTPEGAIYTPRSEAILGGRG